MTVSDNETARDRTAELTPPQANRVAGVLLGGACGDALGVPYEFARRLRPEEMPVMAGGGLGPYAPGEYSDDTQMAVCIAQVTAAGADLRDETALDAVAINFLDWRRRGATDIGSQTAAVLAAAAAGRGSHPARAMRDAAARLHARTGRSAGNGSLMRTAVIGVAYLDDPAATAEAARTVSGLTHHDVLAGDACVLWCAAMRRAVLDGTFTGLRDEGLPLLPASRRTQWAGWLADAEKFPASRFSPNGYVVTALQAAWSAITHNAIPGRDPVASVRAALTAAVRAGNDTDTVAAIAGALLGSAMGAPAIPPEWRAAVHGWPGLKAEDLIRLALRTASRGGSHAGRQYTTRP